MSAPHFNSLIHFYEWATRSGIKAPSSAQTISNEKIYRATKLLLLMFAPSYQTVLIWGSGLQGKICHTSPFQEQASSCVLKFACRDMTCLQLANQMGLFFFSSHTPIGLFRHYIQHPRRVLRVYWLGYLPGSAFLERVSGASSLVFTGLYYFEPFLGVRHILPYTTFLPYWAIFTSAPHFYHFVPFFTGAPYFYHFEPFI